MGFQVRMVRSKSFLRAWTIQAATAVAPPVADKS